MGDESLHLPRRRFAEQLDILLDEKIHVVSLNDLMNVVLEPETTDSVRRVAITFDDGYRGAIHIAVEELVRRGLPATMFVVPGLVGDRTFWWDALSVPDGQLSREIRLAVLDEARGRNEDVLHWARSRGLRIGTLPEYARSADEAELQAAANRDGIQIASHTWGHVNLLRLTEDECRREYDLAAEWLRERFGEDPGWLSYPYGLHGPAAAHAAAEACLRGAFCIDGGWITRSIGPTERFKLPRLNIPAGLSRNGFRLRLAGLLCK